MKKQVAFEFILSFSSSVAMNNYHGGGDGSGPSRPRLNVHLAVPPAQTGADGGHTPNTPEILNSIVNMTQGPFTGFVPQLPSLQDHQVLQQQQLAVPCLGVEQPAGENNQVSTFFEFMGNINIPWNDDP